MSQLDRYEIRREIGRGAMGVVHLAFDTQLDREVALKEMSATAGVADDRRQEMVERFEREAKAAGGVEHPNIVRVYDTFAEEDRYFIVMEYLQGRTLSEMLRSGPLEPAAALGVGTQLLEALVAAQDKGIVHRDMKPENVFVLDDGTVKVMDFGVARVEESSGLTRAGQALGTLGYMSPEQVRGEAVDGRSDLFAVGVMLYEMLVGQNPFASDQPTTAMYRIAYEEPPELSLFVGELPAHIAPIVKKATAKDPDLRYPSAAEMLADINEEAAPDVTAIEGAAAARLDRPEAVAAGAAKTPVRSKISRRVLVTAILSIIGVLVLVGAGYAWHLDRVAKEEARAEAIRAEGRMMVERVAELKGFEIELERAITALEKKADANQEALRSWDDEWARRENAYYVRVSEVNAHNSREQQKKENSRQESFDYWSWQWTTYYTYSPRLQESPSYPDLPPRVSVDLSGEEQALNGLLQRVDDFRAQVASESAGIMYFSVVYQRTIEAADVLLAQIHEMQGAFGGLVTSDSERGQIINSSRLGLIERDGLAVPIQQVDQEVTLYTTNYGVSLQELLAKDSSQTVEPEVSDSGEEDVANEEADGQ